MSALLGLHAGDRVHVMTDGASVWTHDGTLAGLHQKQAAICNGAVVVASIGYWPRAKVLAQMADERCHDFDAVVDAVLSLWDETLT